MTYTIKSLEEHLDAKQAPKRILTLDGGGVRGMLSLSYLKVIEDMLRARHGNDPNFRLCHYFDLIAGTSTGAIIASALACGLPVELIQKKYQQLSKQVFRAGLFRWGLIRPKFDTLALERALQDELVLGKYTTLGSPRLKTGLMVMSKRLDTGSPWPLTNNPNGKYYGLRSTSTAIPNQVYPLWKVVRASTAAPYFFKPEQITIKSEVIQEKEVIEEGNFVDGGVSTANNPALQAYQVATLKGFNFGWQSSANSLLLISVGAGRPDPKRHVSSWAPRHAATALLSLMDDCCNLVELQLQWMSNSDTARKLDREIGDLSGDLISGEPLLTYQRYNVEFTYKWLAKNLRSYAEKVFKDEKRGNKLMDEFSKMDNPKMLKKLKEVGDAAAKEQIDTSHFPEEFNL